MTYKAMKEKKKQAPVNQLWMTNPRRSRKHQTTSYGYQRVEFMPTNSSNLYWLCMIMWLALDLNFYKIPSMKLHMPHTKPWRRRTKHQRTRKCLVINSMYLSLMFFYLKFWYCTLNSFFPCMYS